LPEVRRTDLCAGNYHEHFATEANAVMSMFNERRRRRESPTQRITQMRYITAHTPATHSYPPYINVSRNDDMKGVRIIVRSPANPDGSCGSVSFIDLSNAEYKLFLDMESELDDTNAPAST
jgi:hypothetical protein